MPSPLVDPPAPPGSASAPAAALATAELPAVFDALPGLHLVMRADPPHYTIAGATAAYLAATHTTLDAVVGRSVFDVHPDANPANLGANGVANLRAALDAVVATRRPHHTAVQRHDVADARGRWEVRYWTMHITPVPGPGGALAAVVNTVEDVTAREQERRAAAAAEARLEAVFAQAPVPVAVMEGPTHRFVLANPGYERLTGRPRDALIGRTLREAFPELDGAPFFDLMDRVYATGEPASLREVPVALARDTGAPVGIFNALYQPLRDVDGRVFGVAQVALEVTAEVEARRATEVANRELAIFAALTEHSNDAQFLVDERGRLRWANRLACERLGFTRAELLRVDVGVWNPGVSTAEFPRYFERARRGRMAPFESVQRRKDGSEFPVEITPTVIELPEGARMLAAVRDISERKRAEAERARLAAEVARANRAKSEFLATMSHELRTPLNAIGGYAELMALGLRGPVTDEQTADLERIRHSQRHLLGLINGILNYARVEAGAVRYAVDPVPLDEVLAACEALVAPQLRARGLRLTHAPGCAGIPARADGEKVRQVLLNLLGNAVKFTEPGGEVAITCDTADGPDGPRVLVRVSDTGIGIPAHQLARVFDPFVQVDASLTRTREGTGLGLAISRDLARGMGGDLTAESVLGVGSAFTLALPADTGPRDAAADAPGDGAR